MKCAALALLVLAAAGGARAGDRLADAFDHPPASAHSWVYWYWMYGAVSREGIAADLAAMKAAGLQGAYLMPIKGPADKPGLYEPGAEQLTPRWWGLIRYAFAEADRQGLKLAFHSCDGFSIAGGPWITPAESMQRVVSSEIRVEGGGAVSVDLPEPPKAENYYRDIAVLAFPSAAGPAALPDPVVTTNLAAGAAAAPGLARPGNAIEFQSDTPCWIEYAFPQPVTVRTVTVRTPPWVDYQGNRLGMQASDDGVAFRTLAPLQSPRHGWEDNDLPVTHAIVPVTARYFRFVYDPSGSEKGSEDLDSAKFGTRLRLLGIVLGGEPRIDSPEGKSGAIWRVAPPTGTDVLPTGDCVPLDRIVDLSARMDGRGHLVWNAPPGRWTILRLGHTSNGHQNDTGGGGRGLECDKLSAEATRIQFDHWFGEAIRQVGPALAGRVLTVFHIDSWECGSQNWTDDFPAEFRRLRGYDLRPYLPALAGIPVQSADATERFLRDVRTTIDDLLNEKFFGTLIGLAHYHGCAFSSECVAPTFVCDDLRHYRDVDVPMGEFWLRSASHDKPNDVLDAISGAHIYGHSIAQAEAFTELKEQWDEAPALLKPLADINYARGINRFVFHVFAENPWTDRRPGMTLNAVGTFFQRDQTWWAPGRAWFDYTARCNAMLESGRPVVDIAVFTGEEMPRRAILPDRLGGVLPGIVGAEADACDPLHGYAYDCINRDALLRLARVDRGRIVLPGGASYGVLVVPGSRPMNPDGAAMSPEVAARLSGLVRDGATVVWESRPTHSPSLSGFPAADAQVRREAGRYWPGAGPWPDRPAGRIVAGPYTAPTLEPLGIAPDFLVGDPDGKPMGDIAWNHRTDGEADIYFVSNQADRPRTAVLSLRAVGRRPELWEPVTGERHPAAQWSASSGRTVVPVRLAPHGSIFVVLREAAPPAGADTGYNWPLAQPAAAVGPDWEVTFDPAFGGPAGPVHFASLVDWTSRPESGIRYYSGTARYATRLDWQPAAGGRVWLDLGRVADIAEVTVNGRPCGVAWTAPFRVEVTGALRRGVNRIEIAVTNTWANRLVGDASLPPDRRTTWTIAAIPTELRPAGLLGPVALLAENPAPIAPAAMRKVYEAVRTPYKVGIVLAPEADGLVDCPAVFRRGDAWYMLYVANRRKIGYETHLARSTDLLHWTPLGKVLPFAPDGWDRWQGDGGPALVDTAWGGSEEMERYDGRYWMTYIGGDRQGYEPDPLSTGIAWTDAPDAARPWIRYPGNPVLRPSDPSARPFERKTIYKTQVIRDPARSLGYPFVMFYNGKEGGDKAWTERIGMAVSADMLHWTRYGAGPVIDNGYGISGDPQIVRLGDLWVMFYFGAFWRPGAFDTFACSRDLAHWTAWDGPSLVSPSEPWDRTFAHKPWLLEHGGIVYHFYCAVGDRGRAIALATSRPIAPPRP